MTLYSKRKIVNVQRRQVLKAGLIDGAGLLLPWKFNLPTVLAGESPDLEHFVDALPVPRFFQPVSSSGGEPALS